VEALEIIGTTVTMGDPSYAGPLAGVYLNLPVYHVLEPEITAAIPPDVFAAQLGMFELITDTEKIRTAMERLRGSAA
jgi:betaine reductase